MSKLFGSQAAPMTKTDLIFPAFSSRFVDFAVQFSAFFVSFHSREATLESGLTVAWFFSTNHDSLLRIVTNEIGSFCIDHRLRQMAFSRLRQRGQRRGKGGAKAGFRVMLKYFEINKSFMCSNLFRYYIYIKKNKQIDSMLPGVCSVIDHRRRHNVVRTTVTHSAASRVPLFCSYHILTSSVIYFWTDASNMESIC